ncbi:MAG: disulfide bond formation protein B [Candidatus Pacebacteria bacterium]|nr:disulfide bond formation protein B [Candidatus Paceibacterota bacterium]
MTMTSLVQPAIDIASFFTVIADVLIVVLFVLLLTPLQEKGIGKKIARFFGRRAMLFSFLITAVSVLGSLFFSNVANFAPCLLCWIQRGLLYTEAVILFVAMLARKDERVRMYQRFVEKSCIALSAIGFPIAAYNVYLQLGGGAIIPCSATGPDCAYVYFIRFGYVTIPTMALTAFALILAFMLLKDDAGVKEV